MNKSVSLIFILGLFLTSCSSSKLTCSKFYTYKTNKIDIKGISAKLKKSGVEMGDFTVAEISIDPKYIVASEKLQELDILQYSLCAQIKGLPKKDSLRKSTVLSYISTLQRMIQIAQKPDSLLQTRVTRLEESEFTRQKNEDETNQLKLTPPSIDPHLLLDSDKNINLQINFLNDIPIKYDFYITKFESDQSLGPNIVERPILYPTNKRKTFYHMKLINTEQEELLKDTISKVTLHFLFESIYYAETRNPKLLFKIIKHYYVDAKNNNISQIGKGLVHHYY